MTNTMCAAELLKSPSTSPVKSVLTVGTSVDLYFEILDDFTHRFHEPTVEKFRCCSKNVIPQSFSDRSIVYTIIEFTSAANYRKFNN